MPSETTVADRFAGPRSEELAAGVHAWVGEEEKAIDLLAELLAMPYQNAITTRDLQHDPFWDPLRDHPRFQELIRESS